ncbi:MAG: thioredoxin [Candidatus Hodarchaeales archaeon]
MEILTDSNIDSVIQGDIPILVDFWAVWCRPCKMVAPTLEELAKEYAGKMRFGKLNTDENNSTATKYRIMSIPYFIIFHKGKPVEQFVGALPKNKFVEKIEAVLREIN